MLKKYFPYLFFILLLAGIIALLSTNKRRTLHEDISGFIPRNISLIDKIEITHKGNQLILEKKGSNWKVNRAYDARKELVELLLTSIQRIEIVSPASKMVREKLTKEILTAGRYIKFYSNNHLSRSFYIYYDSLAIKGTYMMTPGMDMPYMVKLKGYSEQNIENLFTPDPDTWRENTIFGYDPADIVEIIVHYPPESYKSYKIYRSEKGGLALSDLSRTLPAESIDLQEISDYLNFFSKMSFRPVIRGAGLVSEQPFVLITVKDFQGDETILKGFRIFTADANPENYDKYRFIAVINENRDTVLINYADADAVMKQLDDFQKK